jgi:REP-associated tyrosine transposase
MARPLRIEYDGALYHVTSRGNERKPIFRDDTDRKLFLNILSQSPTDLTGSATPTA